MNNRVKKLLEKLKENKYDGFISNNLSNVFYLTGYTGSNGLVYITPDRAVFFTDTRYQEQVKNEVVDFEIFIQEAAPLEDLMFEKFGDDRLGQIAFESAHIRYNFYDKLKKKWGEDLLVPTEGLVETLRQVKTPGEIELIREAIRINDLAFADGLRVIKPGITEKMVAAEIEFAMKKHGAEKPSFDTIVASGYRGALPHGVASDKVIEPGDLIVIDMGCFYHNYASDMTRMVVVGEPDAKQREIYEIVLAAQLKASEYAAPGKIIKEMDGVARAHIEQAGYGKEFNHSLGHGVGVDVHEGPRVYKKNDKNFEPGMVLTNEPGIYLPGWGGVRIEDIIRITESGHEVMTQTPKELFIV